MLVRNFNVQAGNDLSGVPTNMLSLNSTVRIFYRNPSTFFAVHVTALPLLLRYSNLLLSSGEMEKFTVGRKSGRNIATVVHGHQIPLYGSVSPHLDTLSLPLNLTLVLRSRAYILGRLVTSNFHTRIICSFTLNANRLPKPMSLIHSCTHHHWHHLVHFLCTLDIYFYLLQSINKFFQEYIATTKKKRCNSSHIGESRQGLQFPPSLLILNCEEQWAKILQKEKKNSNNIIGKYMYKYTVYYE